MNKLKTLALSTALAVPAALAFASPVFAWHINSTCSNSQWIVGIPNESWATGTTATFDFNQGPDATLGKGQATTAPAAATSVVVTFNNSAERLSATRPQGCVVVVQAIPTTTTTTTTAPSTTAAPVIEAVASSSVQVVTLETPAPVVVAVADPPVPQPQGVSVAFSSQTLPATGAGTDLLTLGAAAVMVAGLVMVLIARRRVA